MAGQADLGVGSKRLLGVALGSILPLSWLLFSKIYYGDILSTSFYVKQPHFRVGVLIRNTAYMFEFMRFSGVRIFCIVFVVTLRWDNDGEKLARKTRGGFWWAAAGDGGAEGSFGRRPLGPGQAGHLSR